MCSSLQKTFPAGSNLISKEPRRLDMGYDPQARREKRRYNHFFEAESENVNYLLQILLGSNLNFKEATNPKVTSRNTPWSAGCHCGLSIIHACSYNKNPVG